MVNKKTIFNLSSLIISVLLKHESIAMEETIKDYAVKAIGGISAVSTYQYIPPIFGGEGEHGGLVGGSGKVGLMKGGDGGWGIFQGGSGVPALLNPLAPGKGGKGLFRNGADGCRCSIL